MRKVTAWEEKKLKSTDPPITPETTKVVVNLILENKSAQMQVGGKEGVGETLERAPPLEKFCKWKP